MSDVSVLAIGIPPEIAHKWAWFLVLGIGLVVLGFAAIVRSMQATIVSVSFFGWLLLVGAGIEAVQAFLVARWAGFFLHLLAAILFGVTGALFVSRPVISAEVATVFMAMFFLTSGLFQLISSVAIHLPGWGWHAFTGIITSVLGVLVLAQWPISGLWAIGLFVGIDLVSFGWACAALGLALHRT